MKDTDTPQHKPACPETGQGQSERTPTYGAVPVLAPSAVLAWSEAAVSDLSAGGPFIALWRPEGVTVAIGISQSPEAEMDVDAAGRDGVGLIRRQSGGGAVLLYDGVLCWEAWAGFEALEKIKAGGSGIRAAYEVLCGPVVAALEGVGVRALHAGISDISFAGAAAGTQRKMAGTAQLRRKNTALVHGALLVCPDVEMLAVYLKMPEVRPEYRGSRSHREFCVSVAEVLGRGTEEELMGLVAGEVEDFARRAGWGVVEAGSGEWSARAGVLEREKYGSREWNWERKRTIL